MYHLKGKKAPVATPRKLSYKVPYEKSSFTAPKKNSNISSKDSTVKPDKERKGLYLFG